MHYDGNILGARCQTVKKKRIVQYLKVFNFPHFKCDVTINATIRCRWKMTESTVIAGYRRVSRYYAHAISAREDTNVTVNGYTSHEAKENGEISSERFRISYVNARA